MCAGCVWEGGSGVQVAHPRHRAGACTLNAVGLLPVSRALEMRGSPPLAPPLCVCGDVYLTLPSLFALCMSGQAAAGHDHRAALLQPDLSHCTQPPEHHHRPASCHGELLLHPFARLLRWHTSAFRCSRSASSSPHSCHGAVATHLLAGLSHADSTSLPLWCTPRAATAAGSRPA